MVTSFLNVYDPPNNEKKSENTMIGDAALVMGASKIHSQYPLSYLKKSILEAIRQGNIKFYFDIDGLPVGYVTWAYLDHQSQMELLKSHGISVRPIDWNCGDLLWIVDLLAPFGHIKYILRDLRDEVFSDQLKIRYFRLKKQICIAKEISRESNSYFFKYPQSIQNRCACGRKNCPVC